MKLNSFSMLLGGILLTISLLFLWVNHNYRQDMEKANYRIKKDSRIVETACGLVEYNETGEGFPVLVIHGAGGGFDQGVLISELILGEGYRVIAPSRFGYLNAPIPDNSSLEAQADVYACLLDTLDIHKTAVIAISAGGPSGLTFAMRHPDRLTSLVLYAAISYSEDKTEEDIRKEATINRVIGSDPVYWLTIKIAKKQLLNLFGVSKDVLAELSFDETAALERVIVEMLPMSRRLDGILLDQSTYFPRNSALESITAPTLILHARDDSLIKFDRSEHSAAKIPDAEIIALDTGGHFLAGHYEELHHELGLFIQQHIP